jgi:hypothetical protein
MSYMRVSVAMCTYNGATFLSEQLNSILTQTQPPNELVVCDDGSTDATRQIIEDFAQKAPFEVKLSCNSSTLKVTKNFEKAIGLCTGDIVFLCDQDDVWKSDKVAKIVEAFATNPQAQLVYSNADLINERGELLPKTQWEILRLYPPQIAAWKAGKAAELMLGGNRITGCMVAFRRAFVQSLTPFPTHIPEYIHDGWIGIVGAVKNEICLLEECLTQYRQHPQQQIGIRANEGREAVTLKERFSRPREEKLGPIRAQYNQLLLLDEAIRKVVESQNHNLLNINRKLGFLKMRCELPNARYKRILPVFKNLLSGDYHRFADQDADWKGGFLTALGDIAE